MLGRGAFVSAIVALSCAACSSGSGGGGSGSQLSTACDDLLNKWATATGGDRSPSTCGASISSKGDKHPPALSAEVCMRDTYVDAAVQYCWAAMCYANFGDAADMQSSTDGALKELSNADALCSDAAVVGTPVACSTEKVHGCS